MAAEPSSPLPIASSYETAAAHLTPGQSPSREAPKDGMESVAQRADEERLEDNTSPGTAVEQDDDSDDSIPPVPPVPQTIDRKGSRTRVRQSQSKDYSSDSQMYTGPGFGSRYKQPRFQDEWYEADGPYGSDRAWREEVRHPDYYDRRYTSRPKAGPPRSFLNNPNKLWVEESQAMRSPGPGGPAGPGMAAFSPRQPPSRWYYDEEQGYGQYPHREYESSDTARVQWNNLTKKQKAEVLRLPWLQWMNSDVKNHFVASLGEFVGTTMFLFFAFAGTEVANIQSRANNSSGSDSNTVSLQS